MSDLIELLIATAEFHPYRLIAFFSVAGIAAGVGWVAGVEYVVRRWAVSLEHPL